MSAVIISFGGDGLFDLFFFRQGSFLIRVDVFADAGLVKSGLNDAEPGSENAGGLLEAFSQGHAEHDAIRRSQGMDMLVEIGDDRKEACSPGWPAFGEGGAVEVGIADLPKSLECQPKVSCDFASPGLACEDFGVKVFGAGVNVLEASPFSGAAAVEHVPPANGGLGGD
jgi:hypothetical protein